MTADGVPALALGDDSAILYLHGGGNILGSAYGYRPLVGALVDASATGALVPDFRLAPEHPFPDAIDDALAAYRWLVARCGRARRGPRRRLIRRRTCARSPAHVQADR